MSQAWLLAYVALDEQRRRDDWRTVRPCRTCTGRGRTRYPLRWRRWRTCRVCCGCGVLGGR